MIQVGCGTRDLRLAAVAAVALLLMSCTEQPPDRRADRTVGPTPVGTAGLVGVPPRPSRSPRPDIPFWTEAQATGVAASLQLEPLPTGSEPLDFFRDRPSRYRFHEQREAGLTYLCPAIRAQFGVDDRGAFLEHVRDAIERSGYRRLSFRPPLRDGFYSPPPVYEAVAADGTHEVTISLYRGDPLQQRQPHRVEIKFEQRCNG